MIDWWWELRRDYEGTFWDVHGVIPSQFYIYDDDNEPPSGYFGRVIIRVAQQANPVLTTVYRLTYGSLP